MLITAWVLGSALLWRMPLLRNANGDGSDGAPFSDEDLAMPPVDGVSTGPDDRRPTVSVVIPARNEADRLPRLLADLGAQTLTPVEVLVVDDDSTDETAAVARSVPGVTVLTAPPLPYGWAGKPWACTHGAEASTGDVLVFLDADVQLAPEALASLIETWEPTGGLLSVQPLHRTGSTTEGLSLPFNVVSMMGLGIGSIAPPHPEWGAAGPCMVTSRSAYVAVGGHRGVSSEVVEDLALADRYGAADLAVRCVGGGDLMEFRMYRNLRGLFEGWTKNVASGAGRTPPLRGLLIGIWITVLLTVAVQLARGPASMGGSVHWLAAYVVGAAQVAWIGRRVGRFGSAGLFWPLLLAVFVGICALSAVKTTLFHRVGWSGRTISLRHDPAALLDAPALQTGSRRDNTLSRRPRL